MLKSTYNTLLWFLLSSTDDYYSVNAINILLSFNICTHTNVKKRCYINDPLFLFFYAETHAYLFLIKTVNGKLV